MLSRYRTFDEFLLVRIDLQHIIDYATYELKAAPFKATDAGQVNFYLTAVDSLLRQPEDNPTIGIIL